MKRLQTLPAWLARGPLAFLLLCALAAPATPVVAQGVTTGALSGVVTDAQQQPVAGATVVALHVPSGTTYEGTTRLTAATRSQACVSAVRTA